MTKTFFSLTVLLAMFILFSSAISIGEIPQDPPRGKKIEKHFKMLKIDDQGNKTELDTVLKGDQIFVWNGDTLGSAEGMEWFTKGGDFDFTTDMDFDFDIDSVGAKNVFVVRSKDMKSPLVYEFKSEDDSTKEYRVKVITNGEGGDMDLMNWHSNSNNNVFFRTPNMLHKKMVFGEHQKGNVIDLSDPGIISYEKKELKNGKEKIVIVREKPGEEEHEMHEEIIVHGAPAAPMMFHSKGLPHKAKTIKVIAGDNGEVEIIEDGKLMHLENMEEGEKVIEKDGKKIVIRKIKEGDEVKVKVNVEEEKEEK